MEQADVYILVASLAAGGCVFCSAWLGVKWIAAARAEALRPSFTKVKTSSPVLRLLRPPAQWAGFLVGALAARIEMKLGRDSSRSFLLSIRVRIAKALRAAGNPENLTPDEFLGLIIISALLGLGLGMVLYLRVSLGAVPIATAIIGAIMPMRSLRDRIRRRQREMRHLLPYALDLLTLSVEAGLDFTEALQRIVRRLGTSPLGEEFGETLRQIQLGKTRGQALRDLAARVDLSELRSVVGALIQTDELGGNLGPALRAQSQQLRETRSQVAEKTAMEAPVKILFPLVLFIFPTIFIMIFGPIALKIILEK